MTLEMFVKGLIIGFSIAAPVGPIGVLCIRRTLEYGRWIGFVSGLGAATADAFYGLVAGLGLTIVTRFLIDQQSWLHVIGSVFLCYLGIRIFFSKPSEEAAKAKGKGRNVFKAYASTFLLTMTNPVTILSFLAIFSSLGMAKNESSIAALLLVVGVFLGSVFWWLLLSQMAGLLAKRVGNRFFKCVNYVSGAVLVAFGVYGVFF